MIRFGKILLSITVVVLLLWLLPWSYRFIFSKPEKSPFVLYSGVIRDFAFIETGGNAILYKDINGNEYAESQFDSILPMFYYRQLIADEKFPAEMNGMALTPRVPQVENFMFRNTPSNINVPKIGLYPLLESMSGRVDLKMPGDVFRITPKRIEFVDMESNRIDEEKSGVYTLAFEKKDFCFPARIIAGNPTTRKDYDHGYLVTDGEGKLFHLKQVQGRPFVRKVDVPEGVDIRHIFVTEFRNQRYLAFITDSENNMYVLHAKSYAWTKLPVESFDPLQDDISVIGNVFDWTVLVAGEKGRSYYAIDAQDYSLLKTWELKTPENRVEKIYRQLFLLRISFTSYLDKYVKMRINS